MFNPNTIIVEKPRSLPKSIKLRDNILTIFFWSVLIYLFRPLFALLMWILFGYHVFNPSVFNLSLYHEVERFLVQNALLIALFAVMFISWVIYNYITFGHLRRRKKTPQVDDEKIAKDLGVDVGSLMRFKEARYLKLTLKNGIQPM